MSSDQTLKDSDQTLKVMGVMTKLWDYHPGPDTMADWKSHAAWLVQAVAERRPARGDGLVYEPRPTPPGNGGVDGIPKDCRSDD